MAGLSGTITLNSGEYRPCIVGGKKALFHRWIEHDEILLSPPMVGGHGGVIKASFGIVEFEDGEVAEVYPKYIKFVDNHFKEFSFERDAGNGQN